ncbi:hypothetical protein Syun_009814 [Stephania yunnanensis]|uniref:WLM domain-containing protein n=1 Tax=Stephania yunnanensis TaxID=152371 RepID=A0AAP0KGA8_9MAGN
MEKEYGIIEVMVHWRGKKLGVEINSGATLKEFGIKLQNLTHVKTDTLKLLIPKSVSNSSKLLNPFSDEHSCLSLEEASILEGKPIRMMGVFEGEVEVVSWNGTKADQRILGFDEEEKRLQQRTLRGSQRTIQLPRGAYVFCDFRTLHIPGIELNPPASEALRRMHILASDPGIVAIMNKYRWRVGIMTEIAPVGYVGISPKCILGFNKNHGEEISLRLRTDDLKGFRKYESIKKTLLHELAHMVHSEHDANFYALDKKLNEEATALDWTKSKSHTLSGYSHSDHYEEEYYVGTSSNSQRLGGDTPHLLATARESSVAAAYRRMANFSTNNSELDAHGEPDTDDSEFQVPVEHGPDDSRFRVTAEPDPDDSGFQVDEEADRDDSEFNVRIEPDPDDLEFQANVEPGLDDSVMKENVNVGDFMYRDLEDGDNLSPDHHSDSQSGKSMIHAEPDPSNALTHEIMQVEPDPDDNELRRIKDPVLALVTRLQKSIEMLKSEVNPDETNSVVQTLFKIIRNVIEHPEDKKFRRLRKANPQFQRNVANYKAAMDVLFLVGFIEDIVSDEIGRLETYLVLKRDDPGLLWLAKSSLETSIVHK